MRGQGIVADLSGQIDELREENRQLRDLIRDLTTPSAPSITGLEWTGLTPSMRAILALLERRAGAPVCLTALFEATRHLPKTRDDILPGAVVAVQINKLRRRLEAANSPMEIGTSRGAGYYLRRREGSR